ncbi:transcription regulator [Enterococcus canis]|uniref:Transcription regulator n=1 Tax=Enterococcus canis TaxID=214095 RepID=A0A1L8REN3_9ENTE|nr:MurR/RpiR family transcriptional regulator [Enterococcus canis]OJG18145.1 transcription regulator [Enterococcus canis]
MPIFEGQDTKNFSSTDLAIYQYILSHYENLPQMRVREIAQASHTSASSVMRFIRKMGFNSYPEFRASVRQVIAAEREQGADYRDRVLASLEPQNFSFDFEENVRILADLIIRSDNIVFVGIGISGILCEYGARRLATLGFNSFAVTDPYYPLRPRLYNTTDNLVIAVSNSGETPDLVDMIAYYQPLQDYQIIGITGNSASTLAKMSSMIIAHEYTEARKYGFYDASSQIPTMYIMEKILDALEQHPDLPKQ